MLNIMHFIFHRSMYLYTRFGTERAYIMGVEEMKRSLLGMLSIYGVLPFIIFAGSNFIIPGAIVLNLSFIWFMKYLGDNIDKGLVRELCLRWWILAGAATYSVAFFYDVVFIQWLSILAMCPIPLILAVWLPAIMLFNLFIIHLYKKHPGTLVLDRQVHDREFKQLHERKTPVLCGRDKSIIVFKSADEAVHWRLNNV